MSEWVVEMRGEEGICYKHDNAPDGLIVKLTGDTKVNGDRMDPTYIYLAECGHWTL